MCYVFYACLPACLPVLVLVLVLVLVWFRRTDVADGRGVLSRSKLA